MPAKAYYPVNDFRSALRSGRNAGAALTLLAGHGAALALARAAVGAAPVSAAAPLLVTAVRLSDESVAILEVVGVAGDDLQVAGPAEGTADLDLAAGDLIECRMTAGMYGRHTDALVLLEDGLAGLQAGDPTLDVLAAPGADGLVPVARAADPGGVHWAGVLPLYPTFVLGQGADVAVGTSRTPAYIVPRPGLIVDALVYAKTPPLGGDLVLDVRRNGVSLWAATPANRLRLAAGFASGSQVNFDNPAVVRGDVLTIDVVAVGPVVAGRDVTASVLIQSRA
jgi:hypothetical protein